MALPVRMVEFKLTSSEVRDSGYRELEFDSRSMFMTTVGGSLRYSYAPGQGPTPVSGHRMNQGSSILFGTFQDIINLRMIAESTDVTVTITHKA